MQKIIQISKNHAKQAKSLQWECSRKDGKFQYEKQLSFDALDSQGQIEKYEVFFDPISRKFNIRGNMTVRWIGGTNNYTSIDIQYAFDGVAYRCWKKEKEGREMPPEKMTGQGQISRDLSDLDYDTKSFFDAKGFKQGILPGIPGFILTHTYSYYGMERICDVFETWEKENRVDSIKKVDDKIEITARVDVLQGSSDFFLRVIYDPTSDTIEHGTVFSRFEGENVMEFYEVIFRTNEQGFRVPDSIKIVMPLDKRAIIVTYHSFRFVDTIQAELFQFIFPDGIYVNDHIAHKYFKVGDLLNEDKAIDEFIQRHGLTGDVPLQVRRGNTLRYVMMCAGLILIGIALYQMVQKWRKT